MSSEEAHRPQPCDVGALAAVRVLDLTESMAGAVLAMMLRDVGAEVIAVDRCSPEPGQRGVFETWDRDKRRVAADLDDAVSGARVAALAAAADAVLVEPLRRPIPESLTYESLARANNSLVYCSIGGDRLHGGAEFAYPSLATASLGIMGQSPGHRDGPIYPGHPALSYATAMTATLAVLACLHERLTTGRGRHTRVTYTDGRLAVSVMNWWSERGVSIFRTKDRNGHLDFGRYRQILQIFECSDHRLIQVHTAAAGAFARAVEAFGLTGSISESAGVHQFDTELTDSDLAVIKEQLPTIIRSRPADYWMRRLWAHDVACLPLQPPGVALSDEQVIFSGLRQKVELPDGQSIEQLGSVIKFSDSPSQEPQRVHGADEDGPAVWSHGWTAPGLLAGPVTPEVGSAPQLPLRDVTVLDLCSWFAGPYGSRLLADLGATVIKVEPLAGDPLRTMPDPCEGANRGKQSIAMDLKHPAAAEVLSRLVRRADVLQLNLRPGAAERLGIDFETARGLRGDIVYNYAPGYGATGPKSGLQSFAPLLSGFVGVNHMSGGEGNPPNGFFGNEDYYNGMLSAIGILTALIHRGRTGRGQYVETPQLHSSLLFSSEWHLRDGEIASTLPKLTRDQTGLGPFDRIYQCLDGWIALVAASEGTRIDLARTVLAIDRDAAKERLAESAGDPQSLADALQYAFFAATAVDWTDRLGEAGVAATPVYESDWFANFLADDDLVEQGLVYDIEHPEHGHIRVLGSVFQLDGVPALGPRRSPLLGEHTESALRDLGFEAAEIKSLIKQNVVRTTSR